MAKEVKKEEPIDVKKLEKNLKKYVDDAISDEMDKTSRKFLREKNRKIFYKNIVILILIAIIGLLVYLLYKEDYFDKYFCDKCEETVVVENNETVVNENETVKEPTLDELIDKYSYLLDNININEESIYLKDYYDGKLTSELKNYLSLNNMNFKNFEIEEDYNLINESDIKTSYNKIFNSEYENTSFDYNGQKIRYFSKLASYVTDSILNKNESNIKREIINIDVKDNKVIIYTIEGLVKDNKLYSISNVEIGDYKKNSLNYYKDKLNTLEYIFIDGLLDQIKRND